MVDFIAAPVLFGGNRAALAHGIGQAGCIIDTVMRVVGLRKIIPTLL